MNKFAQQLTDDIVEMTMYKIACWAKLADAEPPAPAPEPEQQQQQPQPAPQQPQPAPQQPQPAQAQGPQLQPTYPTNIREMSPRRAAEALIFEDRAYTPMMLPDYGERNDIRTTSPVTGTLQGMPQRISETAMESASGMNLPRLDKPLPLFNDLTAPLQDQFNKLKGTPYGDGFYNDIGSNASNMIKDEYAGRTPVLNPGRTLRRQQNFY